MIINKIKTITHLKIISLYKLGITQMAHMSFNSGVNKFMVLEHAEISKTLIAGATLILAACCMHSDVTVQIAKAQEGLVTVFTFDIGLKNINMKIIV